jgi:hypothetical protein
MLLVCFLNRTRSLNNSFDFIDMYWNYLKNTRKYIDIYGMWKEIGTYYNDLPLQYSYSQICTTQFSYETSFTLIAIFITKGCVLHAHVHIPSDLITTPNSVAVILPSPSLSNKLNAS